MHFITKSITLIFFIFFLQGCQDLTKEESEELWGKAQTTGQIVKRSGTKFNPATNKDLALRDARTRLQTGGGLLGKDKGLDLTMGNDNSKNQSYSTIGMPINPYLWRASLETIDFMPLSSADPFGGIIITDWYSTETKLDERCKLNIFIKGVELKTENLSVKSYCQKLIDNNWVNTSNKGKKDIKIENAILNKAKKLKLSLS